MKTKTIDARELSHSEKQGVIFPAVDALKQNDILKIILEFNPIPMVQMFKARNEFDLSFEKEGPEEWIPENLTYPHKHVEKSKIIAQKCHYVLASYARMRV